MHVVHKGRIADLVDLKDGSVFLADFDGAIENDHTPGRPTLTIDRLIEEGDSVVAVGSGSVALAIGGRLEFVFSEGLVSSLTLNEAAANYEVVAKPSAR